jgi:Ca-activated chloride channel homolog
MDSESLTGAATTRRSPVVAHRFAAFFAFWVLLATLPALGDSLPPRHREFLEEAAPLLTEEEANAFRELGRGHQRDEFIRRFWRVRDPFPETPRNELEDTWRERVKLAREAFESLDGDRPRAFLLLGPPARRWPAGCGDVVRALEVWRYDVGGRRGGFSLLFLRAAGGDGYRLWRPTGGLAGLLAPGAIALGGDGEALQKLAEVCPRGSELVEALGSATDFDELERRGALPGRLTSPEWLATFLATTTDLPAGARVLPAEVRVGYPGREGARTVLQVVLGIDRAVATVAELGGRRSHHFQVEGEILRGDELFDRFRYRFDFAAEDGTGLLPLVVQRRLRPGEYRLVLRVEDVAGSAFFRHEETLQVPSQPANPTLDPPALPVAAAAPVLAEADAAVGSSDVTLELLSPTPGLRTGKLRVEAKVGGTGVARVAFLLDGKVVLKKATPPWSVEIALGDAPRVFRLEAQAESAEGRVLARDELPLNAGPHRFDVRFVEPRRGAKAEASVRAVLQVTVPEGEVLERVELFRGEEPIATLYDPPFVLPVLLPPGGAPVFLRAVAHLAGGTTAEDLVTVNPPPYLAEVDVELVELYTTVVDRRGRPVEGLTAADFKISEDGAPQTIERFEWAQDVPVHAALLLDTSSSMAEELPAALQAAQTFFDKVLTPRDRAAVVTFADRPELVARFTADPSLLAQSIGGVRAEGETALHDAVVFGLHYLSGIRGKRALILLTDGADSRSRYRFPAALDFARRTGVAVYTIGLNILSSQAEARMTLQRLADETGGRAFFIERTTALPNVYETIEGELRSQYLLAYSSTSTGKNQFRAVKVELSRPGLEAKTLAGYYP